jgi:hypothetical protein
MTRGRIRYIMGAGGDNGIGDPRERCTECGGLHPRGTECPELGGGRHGDHLRHGARPVDQRPRKRKRDLERALNAGRRVHVRDLPTGKDGRLVRPLLGSRYTVVIGGQEYIRDRTEFDVTKVEDIPVR